MIDVRCGLGGLKVFNAVSFNKLILTSRDNPDAFFQALKYTSATRGIMDLQEILDQKISHFKLNVAPRKILKR